MRIEHVLPPVLLGRRPVRVLVVGAGGTGSAITMGLPYLHQAMLAWGHAYGLEVTLMDADKVSETNCVRQPYSWSDTGNCDQFNVVVGKLKTSDDVVLELVDPQRPEVGISYVGAELP